MPATHKVCAQISFYGFTIFEQSGQIELGTRPGVAHWQYSVLFSGRILVATN